MTAAGATRVSVQSLKLTSYRNYASLTLALDGRPVVLTGPNGAGKTNLLEAISFLSPGRGLRRADLDEVARRPGDGAWAVAATIRNASGDADLGTGVALGAEGPEARRSVRVNHAPVRSTDALLEHLRVIWLTPAMDGLFTGPAAERRRFLDRAVYAIDRQHGTRVNAFEKAMRGRNKLLAEGPDHSQWLDAIETEMAELAIAIAAARREWASHIAALIEAGDKASPFPWAEIALEGPIEHWLDGHSASADRRPLPLRPRGRAPARCRGRAHARRAAPLRPPRPSRTERGGGGNLLDRRAEGPPHWPRAGAGAPCHAAFRRDADRAPRRDRGPPR